MASLLDHIEYLSQEIGAHPAGTEEEQQAALYIADQFQKESSFPAAIEEFTSTSNLEGARAILAIVTLVVSVLAMFFGVLTIPALVLAAIAAAIYALEAFDKPIVSKLLARGASQNVIAKYQPFHDDEGKGRRGRSHKVVFVAHYDTGKVVSPLVSRIEGSGLPIGLIVVGAMIAAAFLLFVRLFAGGGGAATVILNVITVICLLVVLLPIVKAVLMHIAPYNEGANNNASGVAALIEVARRISSGSLSEEDLAEQGDDVVIHGEAAARERGLVPEGAQIRYEAEQIAPPDEIGEYDEGERLLSAKAAIAALTGQPVERKIYGSVAGNLVNSRASSDAAEPIPAVPAEYEQVSAGQAYEEDRRYEQPANPPQAASYWPDVEPLSSDEVYTTPIEVNNPYRQASEIAQADASGFKNAPSWFVAAQRNAKKPAGDAGPIQRSRYTEAIESAERGVAQREQERLAEERMRAEEERRAREEAARAAIEAAQMEISAVSASESQEHPVFQEPTERPAKKAPEADVPVQEEPQPALAESDERDLPEGTPAEVQREEPAEQAEEDPSKTMAHAPIDIEEIKRELEQEDGDEESELLSAPPAEFSMPSRRFELPSIENAQQSDKVAENQNPSRSGLLRRLRTDIPSLSGIIRLQEEGEDVSQKSDSTPPASRRSLRSGQIPAIAGESSPVAFPQDAPNAVAAPADAAEGAAVDYDMSPNLEDIEFAEAPSEQAAPAPRERTAPTPRRRPSASGRAAAARQTAVAGDSADVDMPESRAQGLLGRFRRKGKEQLEETPQEWLNVDEDFSAREVGRKRGGWESFRDEQYDDQYDDAPEQEEGHAGSRWNGGAFSRLKLGHVSTLSTNEEPQDELPVEEPAPEPVEEDAIAEEIEQIYHFRNPLFNTEVWFVAIGSDTELHDGARAFVEAHRDELRGCMIIEVESLGLGELATASEEGRYRKLKASSRVKRYMRQATAATGIAPGTVSLAGYDSITTVVQKSGLQAMHLLGVEDGRPALKGSADDVVENIDEMLLDENVNFLLELAKRG